MAKIFTAKSDEQIAAARVANSKITDKEVENCSKKALIHWTLLC